MQATMPPWLWSSGLVLRRRYPRRRRSRLSISSDGDGNSHLRIDTRRRPNTAWPAPAGWDIYPNDLEARHLAMPTPDSALHSERSNVELMEPAADPTAATARGWSNALRDWMTGTSLLVLLVLLAIATGRKLFKRRRRSRSRSPESPTPTVRVRVRGRAASRSDGEVGTPVIPGVELAARAPASLDVNLPPPYSACGALPHKTTPDIIHQDPPPPYSLADSRLDFSNKNGIPSIHIFSKQEATLVDRRQIDGTTSYEAIENEHNQKLSDDNDTRVDDVNSENMQRSEEMTGDVTEDGHLKRVIIV